MSTILSTFPGKFGDLLWALPTIRALSRRLDQPIDLLVAAPMASICALIEAQDYIGTCWAEPTWQTLDTAPISPRVPRIGVAGAWDLILHLGYRGWPMRPLPFETKDCYNDQILNASPLQHYLTDVELDLGTPWITTGDKSYVNRRVCVGFTDEHFELKYGITHILRSSMGDALCVGANTRWTTEAHATPWTWEVTAKMISHSRVLLGCCSALHVLAVAVGTPVICMEPNPHRHHPIFYPLGTTGPQVTLVRGNDGLPTFDARAVREALHAHLR